MARTRKLSTKVLKIRVTKVSAGISVEIPETTSGVQRELYTEIGIFVGKDPLYFVLKTDSENEVFIL